MARVSLRLLSYFAWGGADAPRPIESNCLLHTAGNRLSLKQVQFNTVSLSFDPLSERATNVLMCFRVTIASVLAEGLAEAHDACDVHIGYVPVSRWNINELILILCSTLLIVRPNKCNVFDQLWLECARLLEKYIQHFLHAH